MLSIPLPPPCQSNERVNGPLCKDRTRKTIDRFHPAGLWRRRRLVRLVLAHGSNRQVVILGRTCVWLVVPHVEGKGLFFSVFGVELASTYQSLPYVAVAWQEIPAALNLTRVQKFRFIRL